MSLCQIQDRVLISPGVIVARLSQGGTVVGALVGPTCCKVGAAEVVVADIAPVAYSHDQGRYIEAMRGVDLSSVSKRSDAAAQLAETVPEKTLQSFFTQSLDVTEKQWKLNLDVLDDQMDKIVGFPEVEGSFEGPALFLSGGKSDYVLPEYRDRIRALFPHARFAKLPDAGHWLHAEEPRAFEQSVRAFLEMDL